MNVGESCVEKKTVSFITDGGGIILAHVLQNQKERLDLKHEVMKRLLELDLNFVCVLEILTYCVFVCSSVQCPLLIRMNY